MAIIYFTLSFPLISGPTFYVALIFRHIRWRSDSQTSTLPRLLLSYACHKLYCRPHYWGENTGSASCLRALSRGFTHSETASYSHTLYSWWRRQADNNKQSDTNRCVKTIRYYCKTQLLQQGMDSKTDTWLWRSWWLEPDLHFCVSAAQTTAFFLICTCAVVCVWVAIDRFAKPAQKNEIYRQDKNINALKSTAQLSITLDTSTLSNVGFKYYAGLTSGQQSIKWSTWRSGNLLTRIWLVDRKRHRERWCVVQTLQFTYS